MMMMTNGQDERSKKTQLSKQFKLITQHTQTHTEKVKVNTINMEEDLIVNPIKSN